MAKIISLKQLLVFSFVVLMSTVSFAQEDNSNAKQQMSEKRKKQTRDSFKLSGGLSFNSIDIGDIPDLDPETAIGYSLGLSYKRGRFFYWELGARLNRRDFDLVSQNPKVTNEITVTAIDVPATLGVNLTSFVDRLVGVRLFASAVPSFTIDSDLDDLSFDDFSVDAEDFNMYAQFGVGVDFTVLFLEAGYNFGFDDVISNGFQSVPNQFFVLFGFRL